jgi:hypothetical protein
MRFWFSGPRLFNGLVRPGVSFGPGDVRALRAPATQLVQPAYIEAATLGIARRPDGALILAIPDQNGDAEHTTGLVPLAAFVFRRINDAIEVRSGALLRLGSVVAPDSWISGKSTGQIIQAVQAEAKALGLDPKCARVRIIPGEPGQSDREPEQSTRPWTWADIAVASLLPALLILAIGGGWIAAMLFPELLRH